MKNKFCDVFLVNAGENQVLITTEFNNDDKETSYEVCQRTDFNGIKAEIKLGFTKKTEMNKAFKKYNKDHAQLFYNTVSKFISDNS